MKLGSKALAIVLAVAAAAAARAQESRSALSLVPGDAVFVAWADGPKKIADAFADSRLADLLGGNEVGAALRPAMEALRAKWEEAGFDAEQVEEALLGYEGRFLIAVGLDAEVTDGLQEVADLVEAGGLWFVMVLSADGQSDLPLLQETLAERWEQEAGEELEDLTVEGRTFRVGRSDEFTMTVPFMEGSHMVMVMGGPLEATLTRCLMVEGESFEDGRVPLPRGSAGCWGRLAPLWSALDKATEDVPFMGEFLEALGLRALERASMTVLAAGEHVVVELALGLGEANAGVLAAITEVDGGEPRLLDVVPVQRDVWSVQKVSLGALYRTVMDAMDSIESVTGKSSADLEDAFTEMFRVRLKEDLVDHLGDELLSVGQPQRAVDPGLEADSAELTFKELEGACYGIALRDSESFGRAFETMLRSRGMHAARKTEDYRGFKVHRIMVFGALELFYSISDRVFVLGMGERGAEELRAVLDEEKARGEGTPRRSLPPEVAQRLDHAEEGWQSISVTTIGALLEPMLATIEASAEMPAEIGARARAVGSLVLGLLERYHLDTLVSVTRADRNGIVVRMIW